MNSSKKILTGISGVFVALVALAALVLAGCSAAGVTALLPTSPSAVTVAVPVSITDAPSDQVIAASLTLNTIVLTDSSGKTASLISSPVTFEASHLDAVQEPLVTPTVAEDTYVSAALTYSNAQVAYIDPTTGKIVQATATLANTSQTITFTSPIVISSSMTSLIIDYLVASSVSISGSTVTVTPTFNIAAAPIQTGGPTNGTNGLQCGVKGQVTALGTTSFTLTNSQGTALTINVNSSTQYQGLSGFSALAVGALVEVDTATQSNGSLLAVRIEEQGQPPKSGTPPVMLVGPVTAVTGSPATSFTQASRQQIGTPSSPPATVTNTIAINGSTTFQIGQRLNNLNSASDLPMPTFNASTLFAGQVVSVVAASETNNAATAESVYLSPQTINGTVAATKSAVDYKAITVTLPTGSALATLTGQTSVTVYTNANLQSLSSNAITVGSTVRFNGFLFKSAGSLVMVADVQAPPPGQPISPTASH